MAQTITAKSGNTELVWQDGELSGSESAISAVTDQIKAAELGDWKIPIGYPATIANPNVAFLAMTEALLDFEIEADPPLVWEEEVIDNGSPSNEITPEELGINEQGGDRPEGENPT